MPWRFPEPFPEQRLDLLGTVDGWSPKVHARAVRCWHRADAEAVTAQRADGLLVQGDAAARFDPQKPWRMSVRICLMIFVAISTPSASSEFSAPAVW